MIQRVYEQVVKSKELTDVIVATDDQEIAQVVKNFGGQVVITEQKHETGSDRIAEVAQSCEADFIVNVQGDEPLIQPQLIDDLVKAARQAPDAVITAKVAIKNKNSISDQNVVKVVTAHDGHALYFSRSPLPFNRMDADIVYDKHVGIYCYPKAILQAFVGLAPSYLEQAEGLEQLRLLENGYPIKVVKTNYEAVGVDTEADIQKVERLLGGPLYA